jgi:hypothetical protein
MGAASAAPLALRLVVAPHPVEPGTRLRFETFPGERVTAHLYDVRGSLVTTVYDEIAPRGSIDQPWNVQAANGSQLSSGVYFLRVSSGASVINRRVVLAQ